MKTSFTLLLLLCCFQVVGQSFSWVKSIGGNGHDGTANQLAKDSDDNIYVIGQFKGTADFGSGQVRTSTNGSFDIFIAKYTPDGTLVLVQQLSSTGDANGADILVDANGFVYITGNYSGNFDLISASSATQDAFIAKFDSDLNLVNDFVMSGSGEESGMSLDMDGNGNIYAAGYFTNTMDFNVGDVVDNKDPAKLTRDIWLIKLNPSFDIQYKKTMGGSKEDSPTTVKVNNSTIYITGRFVSEDFTDDTNLLNEAPFKNADIFLIKLEDQGTQPTISFFQKFGGDGFETPQDMAIESSGGNNFIYLAGRTNDNVFFNPANSDKIPANEESIFIAKYKDNGNAPEYIFAKSFGGITGKDTKDLDTDRCRGISLTSSGSFFVTGEFYREKITFNGTSKNIELENKNSGKNGSGQSKSDVFVAEFNKNDGEPLSAFSINGPDKDEAVDVLADNQGNVYVTGSFVKEATFTAGGSAVPTVAGSIKGTFLAKYVSQFQLENLTLKLSPALTGELKSPPLWTDFTNDGLPDIVLIALEGEANTIIFYKNDGINFIENQRITIDSPTSLKLFSSDFNNDGFPDLLVDGYVYFNNSGRTFTQSSARLSPGSPYHYALADYNNDGFVDILQLYTSDAGDISADLFRNSAGQTFSKDAINILEPVYNGTANWADLDKDGDMDLLISGHLNLGGFIADLYINTGGTLKKSTTTSFSPVTDGFVEFGDVDNDGDLDILLSGNGSSFIYLNDVKAGTFTEVNLASVTNLTSNLNGRPVWGDYDNDGDLDICQTGNDFSSTGTLEVYKNESTPGNIKFSQAFKLSGKIGNSFFNPEWIDIDKDGKLDIAFGSNSLAAIQVLTNKVKKINTDPKPPTGLTWSSTDKTVTLSWEPGSDKETPTKGLSYNIRVGTSSGSQDILSALSKATGKRLVNSLLGNTNLTTTWHLTLPDYGTYFWSVQSIDQGFAGSEFATEQSFTIVDPNTPVIDSLSPDFGVPATLVTIHGKNFGTDITKVSINFGNGALPVKALVSPQELNFEVPDSIPKTYNVSVKVGTLVSEPTSFSILPPNAPLIASVEPDTVNTGEPLTIIGENFGTNASLVKVFFRQINVNLDSVSVITTIDDQHIVVNTPDLLTDLYDVIVQVNGVNSNSKPLTIIRAPTLTDLKPDFMMEGEPKTITLTGTNFGKIVPDILINFMDANNPENIIKLQPDTVINDTTLLLSDAGLTLGTYKVSVSVRGITTTNLLDFKVLNNDSPILDSVTPTSGIPGTTIKLTGQKFGSDPKVIFKNPVSDKDTIITTFTGFSDTLITLVVPEIPGGLYKIGVIKDTLTSITKDFTVAGLQPDLTAVEPDTVKFGTHTNLTITGSNFGTDFTAITVIFTEKNNSSNTITKEAISVNNQSSIVVDFPGLGVGAYKIEVNIAGSLVHDSLTLIVENIGSEPPIITSSDSIGNSKTKLTIKGTHFGSSPQVLFTNASNSVNADSIQASDTAIMFNIPTALPDGFYILKVVTDMGIDSTETPFLVDNTAPVIDFTTLPNPGYFNPEEADINFSVNVEDEGSGIKEVILHFRGIRIPVSTPMADLVFENTENNTFTTKISSNTVTDELGLEYNIIATDSLGNTTAPSSRFFYKDFTNAQEAFTINTKKVAISEKPVPGDYNLISIPFQSLSVANVFESLGASGVDKDWLLYEYNSSSQTYKQFTSGSLDPKKGYMLIYRNTNNTVEAKGKVSDVSQTDITLAHGFTMIGNPYPFDLTWDDIVNLNSLPDSIKFLKLSGGTFVSTDNNLKEFQGGFVFNNGEAITIKVPHKNDGSGRKKQDVETKLTAINQPAWKVPLVVESKTGKIAGAIGMNPKASTSYDALDDVTVPRFLQYLEINFHHPEFFYPKFSKDIVPETSSYTWEFEIASNLDDPTLTLTWDNSYFGLNDQQLILLDMETQRVTDMRKAKSYTFFSGKETHEFKIFYGDAESIGQNMIPEQLFVGEAFPNPMANLVAIPVSLPKTYASYPVEISIYTMTGQLVRKLTSTLSPGYQTIQWDRQNQGHQSVVTGLYFYRVQVNHQTLLNNGRIIVK